MGTSCVHKTVDMKHCTDLPMLDPGCVFDEHICNKLLDEKYLIFFFKVLLFSIVEYVSHTADFTQYKSIKFSAFY